VTTRIKICGVTSVADARLARSEGADAIGMILAPGTPRTVDATTAAEIVRAVAPLECVAVVRHATRDEVLALLERVPVARVQFHGDEPPDVARDLPVQVTRALDPTAADAAHTVRAWRAVRPDVDLLADLPKGGPRPDRDRFLAAARGYWLAGGLTAENVAAALAVVRPALVDVARGVEAAPGQKDPARLRAFVAAVRRYDAAREGPG